MSLYLVLLRNIRWFFTSNCKTGIFFRNAKEKKSEIFINMELIKTNKLFTIATTRYSYSGLKKEHS